MDEWGSSRTPERMREPAFEAGSMLRLSATEVTRVERMVIRPSSLLERYASNILTPAARAFNPFPPVVGSPSIILATRASTAGLAGTRTNPPPGCSSSACTARRGDMSKEERRSWFVEDAVKIGVRVERHWDLIDGGAFDARDSSRRQRVTPLETMAFWLPPPGPPTSILIKPKTKPVL